MSEAKLIIPQLGKVLAKAETTSGTKETLLDGNAVFAEAFSWQYTSDNIQRTPLAPERHGVRSVQGNARVTWGCETEMAMPDQFDSGDAPPHPDVWLKACGFAREDFSSAAHEVAFYCLQTSNHESISIEAYEFTADGADADYVSMRGARADFTLEVAEGQRVKFTCSGGLATEADTVANTYQASSAESKAVTYYADKPFVANRENTTIELVNLTDDDVYGGGTPGSPTGAFQVVSLAINGNMEPNEQRGLGAQRNRLGPTGPVTASVTIEEALLSDASAWDPYALRRDGNPLELRFKITQDDATGSSTFFAINAYCQIVGVNHAGDDGKRRLWELELELKYPEDATDGDPAVGTSPTQKFDYNSNTNGLYVDITPTVNGVLALTFYRDAS